MNFRGYAAHIDYVSKIEKKNCTSTSEDKKESKNANYSSSNSAEEEENHGSNSFEILEKLNRHIAYSFALLIDFSAKKKSEYFHLNLFSKLKLSLLTPPPELV